MAKKPKDSPDFEQSLEELEGIIERMEKGELSLEQSLADFERGVQLTRTCQKALKEAEQRVSILMQQEGADVMMDFTAGPADTTEPSAP